LGRNKYRLGKEAASCFHRARQDTDSEVRIIYEATFRTSESKGHWQTY